MLFKEMVINKRVLHGDASSRLIPLDHSLASSLLGRRFSFELKQNSQMGEFDLTQKHQLQKNLKFKTNIIFDGLVLFSFNFT
jgi:hypothetical protein